MPEGVVGQLADIRPLLLHCGTWSSKSDSQAWQQISFPTESLWAVSQKLKYLDPVW